LWYEEKKRRLAGVQNLWFARIVLESARPVWKVQREEARGTSKLPRSSIVVDKATRTTQRLFISVCFSLLGCYFNTVILCILWYSNIYAVLLSTRRFQFRSIHFLSLSTSTVVHAVHT